MKNKKAMNDWIEWHTERGSYWFYGERFRGSPREFHYCRVRRDRVGAIVIVCDGSFMYRSEVGPGRFQEVAFPAVLEIFGKLKNRERKNEG